MSSNDGSEYDMLADLKKKMGITDGECCLNKSAPVSPGSEAGRRPPSETSQQAQLIADLDALDSLFASPDNWCQRTYHNGNGAHCLSGGAELIVTLHGPYDATRFARLYNALNEGMGQTISGWNDKRDRTFADVKKAIADARSRVQSQQNGDKTK